MNDFVRAFHFVGDYWSHHLLGSNHSLADLTVQHLVLSLKAMVIAVVIGVPLGMLLGHIHRFSFIAINVSNLGRALPSLGIIAILLPYTGISETTVIIALVVLAAPPILTNTYVAIEQVEVGTVDAARGLGMRPWEVLVKVELPLALPLIFAGIRTSTVFVVATATLSGFFGGGGLGDVIANPASFGTYGVIGASYVLIVLAILSQIVFLTIEYAVTPRALRRPLRWAIRRAPRARNVEADPTRTHPGSGAGADDHPDDPNRQLQLEQGSKIE